MFSTVLALYFFVEKYLLQRLLQVIKVSVFEKF